MQNLLVATWVIYLEEDVDEFMRKLAHEKGKDVEELVNEWLRSSMQLIQSVQ
ncbi:MAG: hypothetical protein OXI63_26480 [Candidatus Poribacteria bacterium]|nr:hypothetical protein [Candidatus Poribacteria bacterium]